MLCCGEKLFLHPRTIAKYFISLLHKRNYKTFKNEIKFVLQQSFGSVKLEYSAHLDLFIFPICSKCHLSDMLNHVSTSNLQLERMRQREKNSKTQVVTLSQPIPRHLSN